MFLEEKPKTVLTPATEVWYNMSEMKKVFIGVDPGKSGAMAVIEPDGNVYFISYTAQLCYLNDLKTLSNTAHMVVVIERLFARPGKMSSAKANFELGRCCGELETTFAMLGIPFNAVTPQRWQKEYGVSGNKEEHIRIARQLFPMVSLRRTEKCRTDFDGYADALLLAEYGRRHFNG